ncbi:MAG: threonine-phosphate decarboxylase [Edaphobacter sp.]
MTKIESYPLHGGQLQQIAERFGVPLSELLDFSANINPEGPPPSVLSTLRASLDDPSTLTEYPDLQLTDLRISISRYVGVDTQSITVANGFVPLLEAVLRTLRIRRCLLPVPAFVEYRRVLERSDVEVVLSPLDPASNFAYDPAVLAGKREDAILLANPQNPSGVCHNAGSIRDLVARASANNIYVLLDEAFIDYIPEHTLSTETTELSNLIVFRSVTKFHGIPGLRVAYAVANPTLSSRITRNLAPWPVTTLASRAVSAALDDLAYAEHSRGQNIGRRTSLQHELRQLGLTVYPAAANFILFRLPSTIDPGAFWRHLIVEHSIVLRSCANYDSLADGYLRTAVRTEEENARLISALAESLVSFAPKHA